MTARSFTFLRNNNIAAICSERYVSLINFWIWRIFQTPKPPDTIDAIYGKKYLLHFPLTYFVRIMWSIAANYVPNFQFLSEPIAGTLFHLIAMASPWRANGSWQRRMWEWDEAKPGSIYLPAGVPRSFTMWSRDVPQRQVDSRLAPIILKSNWIATLDDSCCRFGRGVIRSTAEGEMMESATGHERGMRGEARKRDRETRAGVRGPE